VQRILALALVLTAAGAAHATPVTAVTLGVLSGPEPRRAGPAAADLRLRLHRVPTGADLSVTVGTTRSRRAPSYFLEHSNRVNRSFHTFMHGNALEDLRQRDQLRLYGPTPGNMAAAGNGVAIFAGTILATAHAPEPLRVLFDRKFHVGPAIFDQGGMGAGFGGAL
jgi:hypothetical protein